MKLTVLMSVRNGEPYVREAVASILDQTYRDYRFLILDNASTDKTREIVEGFRDPRIDLAPLPRDVGQTAALNKGLGLIDTPYVARMDADDVSLPHRLERQMNFLDSRPGVVLVGTGMRVIDGQGRLRCRILYPTGHNEILNAFSAFNPFAHSSVVFQRQAVREAGGYRPDIRYAQDMALWMELAGRHEVANIGQVLIHFRVHQTQAGTDRDLRAVRLNESIRLMETAAGLPGMSETARTAAGIHRGLMEFKAGRRSAAARSVMGHLVRHPLRSLFNPHILARVGMMIKMRLSSG